MARSLKGKRPDEIGSTRTAKNSERNELHWFSNRTLDCLSHPGGGSAAGWGRIFKTGLTIMGSHFQ